MSFKRLLAVLALGALHPAQAADPVADRETAALGWQGPELIAIPWSEAPGATTVITAEEIERSGVSNIFDLLRRVPGVDIRYTPMGGHISIRSSGSSPFSEEVLMLIDGSPYNSPDKGGFPGHPNYTGFFPLSRIERIEVVRGPVSVVYGANAFGGVINIVSKKPAEVVGDNGSSLSARLAAGNERTVRGNVGVDIADKSASGAVEVGAFSGNTPIELNGDADHRQSYLYGAGRVGNFSGSLLHQQSDYGSFSFSGFPTIPAHNDVDIIDTHYDARTDRTTFHSSLTLNRYRGTTCANCHNNQSGPPDNAVTPYVGDERETDSRVRVALRTDTTLTDHQDLTAGFEAERDEVSRDIVKQDDVPSVRSGGGLYAQHQWHAADGVFHLLTGLRADMAEGFAPAYSPRIAAVIEPDSDWSIHVSWSRAYRLPSWNERYIEQRFLPYDIAPNLIVVIYGNPDLQRERIDSAQGGFAWRFAKWAVLRADLYNNDVDNFIYRGPTFFVPGTPNEIQQPYLNRTDPFRVAGGEATLLTTPVKSLHVNLAYAYRATSLPYGDAANAYAPRSRAYFLADWAPGKHWTVNVAAQYSSGYTVSSPAIFGLRPQGSYTLYDAAIHYRIPVSRGEIALELDGHNLSDAHPYETLVAPDINTALRGRFVTFGVRLTF
ncbi:MAG TPA: TonB-dependent receptor [Candidatus Polarisedimenticolaceae bacterium]|nr:TonB-dependent receptor [Candidatus Polarisedimenticolaceae bacterium]